MSEPSKTKTFKIIMSIMIPLLIVVTTVVMVGASFAWFSNADKVTITEITMSTAESHKIKFDLQTNNQLWDNMEYVGQTAFCDSGVNRGKLMTKAIAGENTVDISNRPYYFINTVALDTTGITFDMNMAFDTAKIVTYKYELVVNGQGEKTWQKAVDEDGKPIVLKEKIYSATEAENIKYAFTWFFKKHENEQGIASTNHTIGDDKIDRLKQLDPTKDDVWYTPYGKLEFAETSETVNNVTVKKVYVSKVNGTTIDEKYSIKDREKSDITDFNTNELYDFCIVFAPEKLFWMQYFKADVDKYTAENVYTQDEQGMIFGNLKNQMFYSSRDYSGSTFEFSAVINVTGMREEAQG